MANQRVQQDKNAAKEAISHVTRKNLTEEQKRESIKKAFEKIK